MTPRLGSLAVALSIACGSDVASAPASSDPPSSVAAEAPALPTPAPSPPSIVEAPSPPDPPRSGAVDARLLALEHAPWPVPEGAPVAIVHAPEGAIGEGGADVVLFLHGYSGCIAAIAASADRAPCIAGEPPRRTSYGAVYGVADAHDAAGTATVLVLAQLAFLERDGGPGRFAIEGEALSFVEEALAAAAIDRPLRTVTIAAHSAAFETSIAIVRHGGFGDRLRNVILLDALYSGGPAFLGWARSGTAEAPRTLISLYTGGTTARRSEALGRDAAALGPAALIEPPDGLDALRSTTAPARVLVLDVPVAHGDVPRRFLGPALAALDLPRRAR